MKLHRLLLTVGSAVAGILAAGIAIAAGNPGSYTLDADFSQGTLVNVNYTDVHNQLQLDSKPTPFSFIWVAASARGTIVKIDTVTGNILGEFQSAPDSRFRNPSRTTVDGNGNVWTANRDEGTGNNGSIVKIGLIENGQCVDRNGNGVIDTSTGLGDIKPWLNAGGADDNGGVSTAEDECILIYQRLPNAPNARHVSVDTNNDVWVAGYPYFPTNFIKLAGSTGAVLDSFSAASIGCGGYGGLIDGNNVLWSAGLSESSLLRFDLNTKAGACIGGLPMSYGLGMDSQGDIWNALYGNGTIEKLDPAGVKLGQFSTNGGCSRGVVVTKADNDVWVANSCSDNVTRMDNNGNIKALIPVGQTPTGVAVDAAGKVWVTNLSSNDAMRIDPATNTVDLTVTLGAGAGPYNYSDMTGSTLIAPPVTGTWSVVHDSGITDATWGFVAWNGLITGDGTLAVTAASSTDGVTFGPPETVVSGADLNVANGRYLKVSVTFQRATTGESPILYDLTIVANRPPDCTNAAASQTTIWPPNNKFVPITVVGVTDPDGDAVTITVTAIKQDEPVDSYGDGNFTPDGKGINTATAELRAERSGTKKVPGDGRVYHIYYTAADPYGYTCQGQVLVGVPHDQSRSPIDGGPLYDSTQTTP